jgi:hypothetical protein
VRSWAFHSVMYLLFYFLASLPAVRLCTFVLAHLCLHTSCMMLTFVAVSDLSSPDTSVAMAWFGLARLSLDWLMPYMAH